MLSSIGETPYDLRFSMLGIPVRVHPMFWLMSAIMGAASNDLRLIITWMMCMFVSILVHELGHALAAKSYGWPVEITLYHFGGLASYSPGRGYSRGRAIWISFAGPLAGFCLYGLVIAVEMAMFRFGLNSPFLARIALTDPPIFFFAIHQMKFINLYWGAVNLLPVLPLDGGRICSELLNARSSHNGQLRSLQIGIVVAGLAAAFFLTHKQLYAGLLFGSLAYENYRQYEQIRRGSWS